MAITPARFFSSDPSKARSLAGVDLAEVFNTELVPLVNSFDPPELDLDGEDEAARLRREEFTAADEQRSLFQRQGDEALFLSRRSGGLTGDPAGGITDYASMDSEPTASPSPAGTYDGPDDFVSLVKGFEGYNPNAFGDYKQTSIGYGTKAAKGEKSISKEEADRRLKAELASHRSRVVNHAKEHGYQFNENQINALTSFDFNTGRLEQLTNNGTRDPATIGQKILAYDKAGGKPLPGLVKRRQVEQQLYNR